MFLAAIQKETLYFYGMLHNNNHNHSIDSRWKLTVGILNKMMGFV